MLWKINRTSSDQTRKWIRIIFFTFINRLEKKQKKNFILHNQVSLKPSHNNKYQLIMACKITFGFIIQVFNSCKTIP